MPLAAGDRIVTIAQPRRRRDGRRPGHPGAPGQDGEGDGSGTYVFDSGQNMVGLAPAADDRRPGSTATVRYAEVLNPDGTPYYTNLRGAKATDRYVFKGGGEEIYEPRFTFHGFRYVELSGVSQPALGADHRGRPALGHVANRHVRRRRPMVNQLQSNISGGRRETSCRSPPIVRSATRGSGGWATLSFSFAPQRSTWTSRASSRNGRATWTTGRARRARSATYRPTSTIPATPAWGDAGVVVPWTMYLAYGDTRILEEHYPAMVRWVEYIRGVSTNNLWQSSRGNDFGDWLSIADDTDKAMLGTAFYAHSADLVARAADRLHKDADAKNYSALFDAIKTAFNQAYVAANGKVMSDTQTAYALALRFDLLAGRTARRAVVLLDAT